MSIDKFIKDAKIKLLDKRIAQTRWEDYDKIELIDNQAFYIVDWQKGDLIYSRGIKELLGYDKASLSKLANEWIHPNDQLKLGYVVHTLADYCMNNNVEKGVTFKISYRIRHKNGNYIKVLRQTGVAGKDKHGMLLHNYSILTDITDFDKSTKMNWSFKIEDANNEELQEKIKKVLQTKLTPRELEVLNCLALGFKGKEIAEKLFISIETVKSHRKNLFVKFEASNVVELIAKAREEELIN